MIGKRTIQCIAFLCALAGLTNCAKADIVSAQECLNDNNEMPVVIHNPTAQIGNKKTPWMIVRPDGQSGFANDFTTNAISVVSEDGVNYYAHVEGENGDRTKVIHFTIDKNGLPSKNGDIIDTTNSGEENNFEAMKNRKLIGVRDGRLFFYPVGQYGTALRYNYKTGEARILSFWNQYLGDSSDVQCLLTNNDPYHLNVAVSVRFGENIDREFFTYEAGSWSQRLDFFPEELIWGDNITNMTSMAKTIDGNRYFWGDSDGNVYEKGFIDPISKLPGAISGLSKNGNNEVFATSTATNAFYNVTLGQYNVVEGDNGNPKPMVPKTKDGLVKVIDNRRRGGKFLCVTTKGIHSIDD